MTEELLDTINENQSEPVELDENQFNVEPNNYIELAHDNKTEEPKLDLQQELARVAEEAKAARNRVEQLEAQAQQQAIPSEVLFDPDTGTPLLEPEASDYESDKDYIAALRGFSKKETRARQLYARQQQEQRTLMAEIDVFKQQETQARTRYTDYDQVAHADFPMNELMSRTVLSLENGTDILYWLGKNPVEATRIAELSLQQPLKAVLEITKIQHKLIPSNKSKPTHAPAPLKPLRVEPNTHQTPEHMTISQLQEHLKRG